MIRPQPGDTLPPWTMPSVDAARMKTMAAILRDPYPVHWDRLGNERIGLGPRVINQGPLNLSYIANMLMDWAGPASIRRLTVSFADRVHDGDRVTAHGTVVSVDDDGGHDTDSLAARCLVTCDVWLQRDGQRVVTGTAVVALAVTSKRPKD
jgi:acyl dehydratase